MFNQKVNAYYEENPDYLNQSYGTPGTDPLSIHNCGTTILKYNKYNPDQRLPLQNWSSADVAVESFAMRPIVNTNEYFNLLQKFFSSIIYTDSIELKASNLSKEHYSLLTDYGNEPNSSFIQAINTEVINHLTNVMKLASEQITIFYQLNPICEGFVLMDIDIVTYKSTSNSNHFYHNVIFSVFNTTRYNTVTIKAQLYQDTTPMINDWNRSIDEVMESKDVISSSSDSLIYIAFINLLNNTSCVLGQESDCEFKGYNLDNPFANLLNQNTLPDVTLVDFLQPESLLNNTYNNIGNYDEYGNIKILDSGPSNFESLINQFKVT